MSDILEYVRDRCYIQHDGEDCCWVWRLSTTNKGRTPVMQFQGLMRPVRRVVAFVKGDLPLVGGKRVAQARCTNHLCVNPEHVVATTVSDKVRRIYKNGRMPADRLVKAANAKRRNSKLSVERVLELRASDLPTKHFAQLWGIEASTLNAARRGATWRNLPGNPWQGLM